LTEEEQRAKELISQSNTAVRIRQVHIHSGLGPESSRAGRPIPKSEAEKLAARNREANRIKAMEAAERRKLAFQAAKKEASTLDQSIIFRRVGVGSENLRGDFSRLKFQDTGPAPGSPQESSWSQLKRKTNEPPRPKGPHPDNVFLRGRAQREEASRSAQYTAIGVTPRFITWVPQVQDRENKPGSLLKSVPENSDIKRETRYPSPTRLNSHNALDIAPPADSNDRAGKFSQEAKSQSQRLDTIPKGRDRDKQKRRESFVQGFDDYEVEAADRRNIKREQRKKEKAARKAAKKAPAPTPLLLPEYISVSNLATALRVRIEDFIHKLDELGFEEVNYDYILNAENAALIAMEYNFEPIIDRSESEDLKAQPIPEDKSQLSQRPPVVTIMGHVDHGKTTLLDWLRKSSVAATEHGGITQHIGAFSVAMPSGKLITFLDTPGHAAFLSMRQRGANVTDIVILVVAADDSVKPQTVEAINHARVAKVPIIVAINKVDKEEAHIERVKHDLARHGVEIEDFGGDTQVVCVSGKTGQGMNELEETVITLSEVLDIRAKQDGPAEGWVLEASIKSMGKVATVLVRRGTMRPGDFIVAGKTWARIRCLRNEAGVEISEASPGTPVEIDGWKDQPVAGDEVLQAPTESKAKSVVEYRLGIEEREKMAKDMESINEIRRSEHEKREREKQEASLADGHGEKPSAVLPGAEQVVGPKQIPFIVKGDVSGSVEAVVDRVYSIGNKEVQPHVLRSGVGQITEFDVEHAAVAKGYLINFNTAIDPNISHLAESLKVKIIDHTIIYKLEDEVKETLSAYLPPVLTQRVLGEADIAQVFEITIKRRKHKAIAGCKISNGVISVNSKVRVLRNGETVFDGKCCCNLFRNLIILSTNDESQVP
jgi:translation initiation factor IF-2